MDPQQAANTPHYQSQNGDTELEPPTAGITTEYDFEAVSASLEAKNHVVAARGGETSGLSIIQILDDGTFLGGADPRRDGSAGGRSEEMMNPTEAPEEPMGPSEEPMEAPTDAPSAAVRAYNMLSVMGGTAVGLFAVTML